MLAAVQPSSESLLYSPTDVQQAKQRQNQESHDWLRVTLAYIPLISSITSGLATA